jgi:hypothetical protein
MLYTVNRGIQCAERHAEFDFFKCVPDDSLQFLNMLNLIFTQRFRETHVEHNINSRNRFIVSLTKDQHKHKNAFKRPGNGFPLKIKCINSKLQFIPSAEEEITQTWQKE